MTINLTQAFEFETDSLESYERVLDTIVRVMYKEQPTQYSQLHITARQSLFNDGKTIDRTTGVWTAPRFIHICTIGDYRPDIRPNDKTFDGYAALVKDAMERVRGSDVREFVRTCGDGYNDFFNRNDGSVDVGFRMNHGSHGGWDTLELSLCHIYYGK